MGLHISSIVALKNNRDELISAKYFRNIVFRSLRFFTSLPQKYLKNGEFGLYEKG